MSEKQHAFLVGLAELLEMPLNQVVNELELTDDNHWDSLTILGVIALLDEQFRITIPEGDLAGCKSVGSLLQLIDAHTQS